MANSVLEISSKVTDIYNIVSKIIPGDAIEKEHIHDALDWINSGEQVFRLAKPNVPDKHLVSYFILFDKATTKFLLVDHRQAQLWLPSGGHVELNENPHDTVKRECLEELGINAEFWAEQPIFLTVNFTEDIPVGHIDVSLWYVLHGDCTQSYEWDAREFNGIKWFSIDEIPYAKADPHMRRFVDKFVKLL